MLSKQIVIFFRVYFLKYDTSFLRWQMEALVMA
jgi:hypothetical protein